MSYTVLRTEVPFQTFESGQPCRISSRPVFASAQEEKWHFGIQRSLTAMLTKANSQSCDALMVDLGARRNGFTITITQPPDLVLNRLENLGYKVVGTNTTDHIVIWTLHKQA